MLEVQECNLEEPFVYRRTKILRKIFFNGQEKNKIVSIEEASMLSKWQKPKVKKMALNSQLPIVQILTNYVHFKSILIIATILVPNSPNFCF